MRLPLLNFGGGPGVPTLNFEGGPGVPLLNFEGGPGSQGPKILGPGVLVPLLYHALKLKLFKLKICLFLFGIYECIRAKQNQSEILHQFFQYFNTNLTSWGPQANRDKVRNLIMKRKNMRLTTYQQHCMTSWYLLNLCWIFLYGRALSQPAIRCSKLTL